MYSPNDFQFDGIGYRVSCADVQFFNSEKEVNRIHEILKIN